MDDSTFDAARTALAAARRDARAIESWPEERLPHDLAEAYRLQAAVTRELGAIGGWKVAAVTPAQRESLGVDVAIGAPLLQPWMHDFRRQGAELRVGDFIAPKLECEFAFELGHDLAPRPGTPYTRKEVAEAILAMRIAVEIVDSRLPRGLGALAELSDGFNNGAFVAGPRIHAWHSLDFASLAIVLTRTRRRCDARDRARQRRRDPRRRPVRHRRPARQRAAGEQRAASSPATSSPPARAPALRRCRERAPTAPISAISAASSFASSHSEGRG